VVETIQGYGIVVSPTSRIGRMHRATVMSDGTPRSVPPELPDFQVALEANRDLQLLAFVLREMKGDALPDDYRFRLKRLLRDVTLPQDQPDASFGRDEQFELYVGAVCASAGLKPVAAEPDWICEFDGARYAVAAKRVKSLDRPKDRVKGGMGQVNRAGFPGCVVADISVALNPTNWRVPPVVDDRQFSLAAERAMRRFIDEYIGRFQEWREGTTVQGIMLVDHHVRQDPTHGWGLETLTFHVDLAPHNRRRRGQFLAFARRYERGLPTPGFRVSSM
jgi:hypothetical protein